MIKDILKRNDGQKININAGDVSDIVVSVKKTEDTSGDDFKCLMFTENENINEWWFCDIDFTNSINIEVCKPPDPIKRELCENDCDCKYENFFFNKDIKIYHSIHSGRYQIIDTNTKKWLSLSTNFETHLLQKNYIRLLGKTDTESYELVWIDRQDEWYETDLSQLRNFRTDAYLNILEFNAESNTSEITRLSIDNIINSETKKTIPVNNDNHIKFPYGIIDNAVKLHILKQDDDDDDDEKYIHVYKNHDATDERKTIMYATILYDDKYDIVSIVNSSVDDLIYNNERSTVKMRMNEICNDIDRNNDIYNARCIDKNMLRIPFLYENTDVNELSSYRNFDTWTNVDLDSSGIRLPDEVCEEIKRTTDMAVDEITIFDENIHLYSENRSGVSLIPKDCEFESSTTQHENLCFHENSRNIKLIDKIDVHKVYKSYKYTFSTPSNATGLCFHPVTKNLISNEEAQQLEEGIEGTNLESSCNGIVKDGIYSLWTSIFGEKRYISIDFDLINGKEPLKVNLTNEFNVTKEEIGSELHFFTQKIIINQEDFTPYITDDQDNIILPNVETLDIYVRLESVSMNMHNSDNNMYQKYIIRVIHFRTSYLLAWTNNGNLLELMKHGDDNKQISGDEQLFILELNYNTENQLEFETVTSEQTLLQMIKSLYIQRFLNNIENTRAKPEYRIYNKDKQRVLHFEEIPYDNGRKVLHINSKKRFDLLGLDSFEFHFQTDTNNYIPTIEHDASLNCHIKLSDSFINFHKNYNPQMYENLEKNEHIIRYRWLSRSYKAGNGAIHHAGIKLGELGDEYYEIDDAEKDESGDDKNHILPPLNEKIHGWKIQNKNNSNSYVLRFYWNWDGRGESWRKLIFKDDKPTVYARLRGFDDEILLIMPVISHLLWKKTNKTANYKEDEISDRKEMIKYYFDYEEFISQNIGSN